MAGPRRLLARRAPVLAVVISVALAVGGVLALCAVPVAARSAGVVGDATARTQPGPAVTPAAWQRTLGREGAARALRGQATHEAVGDAIGRRRTGGRAADAPGGTGAAASDLATSPAAATPDGGATGAPSDAEADAGRRTPILTTLAAALAVGCVAAAGAWLAAACCASKDTRVAPPPPVAPTAASSTASSTPGGGGVGGGAAAAGAVNGSRGKKRPEESVDDILAGEVEHVGDDADSDADADSDSDAGAGDKHAKAAAAGAGGAAAATKGGAPASGGSTGSGAVRMGMLGGSKDSSRDGSGRSSRGRLAINDDSSNLGSEAHDTFPADTTSPTDSKGRRNSAGAIQSPHSKRGLGISGAAAGLQVGGGVGGAAWSTPAMSLELVTEADSESKATHVGDVTISAPPGSGRHLPVHGADAPAGGKPPLKRGGPPPMLGRGKPAGMGGQSLTATRSMPMMGGMLRKGGGLGGGTQANLATTKQYANARADIVRLYWLKHPHFKGRKPAGMPHGGAGGGGGGRRGNLGL